MTRRKRRKNRESRIFTLVIFLLCFCFYLITWGRIEKTTSEIQSEPVGRVTAEVPGSSDSATISSERIEKTTSEIQPEPVETVTAKARGSADPAAISLKKKKSPISYNFLNCENVNSLLFFQLSKAHKEFIDWLQTQTWIFRDEARPEGIVKRIGFRHGKPTELKECFRAALIAQIVSGYPWPLTLASVITESQGDKEAESWAGAKGAMQLLKHNFELYGKLKCQEWNIFNLQHNIFAGVNMQIAIGLGTAINNKNSWVDIWAKSWNPPDRIHGENTYDLARQLCQWYREFSQYGSQETSQLVETEEWQLPIPRNGLYPILSSDDRDHAVRSVIKHAWDFTTPYGTLVYPAGPGEIVTAGRAFDPQVGYEYGHWVKVDHENGITSIYAHLIKGSIRVKVGEWVTKDTVLGQVGWTGKTTFGPHLHFEFRRNGKYAPTADFFGQPKEIGLEYKRFANVKDFQ